MSFFEGIRRAFRAPAERSEDVEREVNEELAFHLAMREEKLRAGGAAPEEAAAEARRRFGDVDMIRAECVETGRARLRSDRIAQWFADVARDIRIAFRSLRRAPGFALSAATLLALGIGGTTAVFSVVNAIYFRPLPYPNADRLALVTASFPDPVCDRRCARAPTMTEVEEWRGHARSVEAIGTIELRQGPVQLASGSRVLEGAAVNEALPDLLGLRVFLGRGLLPSDFTSDAPGVLVVSHSAWRAQFGGDSAVVNQIATIAGVAYRIVGVFAPESELGPPIFSFNIRTAEYLVPRAAVANASLNQVVVRLHRGVSWETSEAELAASLRHASGNEWRVTVRPLRDGLAARYRGSFGLLLAAAVVVLLITCMNVGGLLVARLNDRMPELATRTALGAGRLQLVQQVATETALIALAGVAGGLALGYYGTHAVRLIPADRLPFWTPIVMDGRVVAVALGLAAIGAVGLSLAPLAALSPTRIMRGLRDLVAAAPSRARMRGVIVSAEIALSVVLVAVAGILVKQLVAAERRDVGSAKRSVVFLALHNRDRADMGSAWSMRVIGGLRSVPGVASVAVSGMADRPRVAAVRRDATARPAPMRVAVFVDGRSDPVTSVTFPLPRVVTNEYFHTIGVPLVAGRVFTDADNANAPAVAIINAAAAGRAFPGPGERAVGRRIKIEAGGATTEWLTIVGVTADQVDALTGTIPERADLFRPWAQVAATPSNIAVRVSPDADSRRMLGAIRDGFHSVDPAMPIASVVPIEEWVDKQLWSARFTTDVIAVFAAFAVLLACLGVYATVSYVVGRRRRELAIRVAVGATKANVIRIVVRSAAGMIVVGLAAGIVGAVAASRLLRSMWYGSNGLDALVLVSVATAVLVAGFVAAYLPARRAARADPAAVLRAD